MCCLSVKSMLKSCLELSKKTVKNVEKVGFQVISVITNNNAINRNAMALFESSPKLRVFYSHPCNYFT